MTQPIYDLKLEEFAKTLARVELAVIDNTRETQQLKYAYERGKGGAIAARLCAGVFLVAMGWFVQDKIASYETWNRTQDTNQAEINKTVYALENRILKIEMEKK